MTKQDVKTLKTIQKQLLNSTKMHAEQAKKLGKIAGKYMNK
tara:strand:+ start:125 stop:247 length:123 start_codon:yes stop_codon:yes gene_type:complete